MAGKGWRLCRQPNGLRARSSCRVFLIALTNPKAIVFYIAFLPQFIDSHLPAGPQLLALIGTMIVMALLSDSAYALLAGRARGWFTTPARRRLQNRITGTLLIGVGCGLLPRATWDLRQRESQRRRPLADPSESLHLLHTRHSEQPFG